MDAIKSGKKLKHVEVDADNKSVKSMDSRGELLDQIRQGIELKPVQVESRSSQGSSGGGAPEDGLAGALARALAERSRAIHSESSDSDDDEEDDDEWED